ncbi:MAG: hypothetical protein ACRDMH_09635 [Solirubrobacterales bacterium]
MPRKRRPPPFTEDEARQAIRNALCWSDALRALGYRPIGHNIRTLQYWTKHWEISVDHFDPNLVRARSHRRRRRPLEEVLVRSSTYPRGALKERLYEAGLKERHCELCGQGEIWRGRRMALILDHINGIGNDHRLDNLRIVCPNCAGTLDTHCGRNLPRERSCASCGESFRTAPYPSALLHARVLQPTEASASGSAAGHHIVGDPPTPRPQGGASVLHGFGSGHRRIELCRRRSEYRVSDNAIRKWLAQYEREFELYEPSTDLATASSPPSRDRHRRPA